MADKSVGELIAAQSVTPTDLFVLEQNGTAKKLTGQILENWLVSFANGHGGIHSIVKHSTSGLKDTYRITLADTTTFDFVVTNGKSISSVDQTDVSGLTRTYTIAFNDGTSKTFTVTDGRSITDIVNTGTNVLTDTYTISYNDGTTSTFTVKNGKGIKAFAKVSTVGLVDTYRIDYTDNSSSEFTVTNGAKGDKGDNQYVWIKYASMKPTASSHSMGDVADNWIGIYSGASSTAPTDWQQYEWFQIKGEKGETGAAATLISSVVEYQVSDSGTIIPSGAWSASVPVVAQGKYLWTRITNNFNTGSPVISYSVSRMGLDGSGSVSSVADISPDGNGNVPLTATHIGALPNTGGDMTGELRMNGQPISGLNAPTANHQAANMGFVNQQVKKAAPRNLLDNSDFTNPVNQRGKKSYTAGSYGLDRWIVYNSTFSGTITVTTEANGTKFTSSDGSSIAIGQRFVDKNYYEGKYTCQVRTNNGKIITGYTEAVDATNGVYGCYFWFENGTIIEWAALYEGEYTAETLPEYQPKGYEHELLICRQYDPNTGEYIGLRKFGQPRNLLDNSDFTNPVNQRGKKSYSEKGYNLDRWLSNNTRATVTIKDDCINLQATTAGSAFMRQTLPNDMDGIYTLAICVRGTGQGQIYTSRDTKANAKLDFTATADWSVVTFVFNTADAEYVPNQFSIAVLSGDNYDIKWAALYEGEYTPETLPEYQPKGYAVELAECQRYYYRITASWKWITMGICISETQAMFTFKFPQPMRAYPTPNTPDPSLILVRCGADSTQTPTALAWEHASDFYDIFQLEATVSGAGRGEVAGLYFDGNGVIEFSADFPGGL